MRKFMSRAVVPILTAACMTFQTGTAWAAPTGPAQEALSQGRWEFGDGTWKYYDSSGRYGRDGSRQQEAGTIWIPATVHCGLGGRTSADIYFI